MRLSFSKKYPGFKRGKCYKLGEGTCQKQVWDLKFFGGTLHARSRPGALKTTTDLICTAGIAGPNFKHNHSSSNLGTRQVSQSSSIWPGAYFTNVRRAVRVTCRQDQSAFSFGERAGHNRPDADILGTMYIFRRSSTDARALDC
jgi:hypothetical protein